MRSKDGRFLSPSRRPGAFLQCLKLRARQTQCSLQAFPLHRRITDMMLLDGHMRGTIDPCRPNGDPLGGGKSLVFLHYWLSPKLPSTSSFSDCRACSADSPSAVIST